MATTTEKAWDDWNDSLIKHDNKFVHIKERTVKYSEPFSLDEFRSVLLDKSPTFIYCDEWSIDKPLYEIKARILPEGGITYVCNSWSDKSPVNISIADFYVVLKLQGLERFRF